MVGQAVFLRRKRLSRLARVGRLGVTGRPRMLGLGSKSFPTAGPLAGGNPLRGRRARISSSVPV